MGEDEHCALRRCRSRCVATLDVHGLFWPVEALTLRLSPRPATTMDLGSWGSETAATSAPADEASSVEAVVAKESALRYARSSFTPADIDSEIVELQESLRGSSLVFTHRR